MDCILYMFAIWGRSRKTHKISHLIKMRHIKDSEHFKNTGEFVLLGFLGRRDGLGSHNKTQSSFLINFSGFHIPL